ncbi:MAG: hypothetical protein ACYTG0_22490 [Planctomycetota bacterium]|jgi:hypothetical protein
MSRFDPAAAVRLVVPGVVLAMVLTGVSAAAAEVPSLAEVTKAYRQHYQAVKTLKVVYEKTSSPLIDTEVLEKHGTSIGLETNWALTVVSAEGKLYSYLTYTWPARNPKDRKREKTKWYDGSRIIEKGGKMTLRGVERHSYGILGEDPEAEYWMDNCQEYVLFATLLPGLPKDNARAKRHRIPDLFSGAAFSVSDSLEKVGGTDCVVVEAPGHDKLWLDPKRGFALRRRELWREGILWETTECHDLAQLVPGVWMPKTVTRTYFGSPAPFKLPAEYEGKPYCRTTLRVKTIEANDPKHLEAVTFRPEPGATILDPKIGTPVF